MASSVAATTADAPSSETTNATTTATRAPLLKTKGLAMPPLAMQQSDGFQNPWHCLACDNWNSSRYTHCIKCASDRTTVDGSHTESSGSGKQRKKSSRPRGESRRDDDASRENVSSTSAGQALESVEASGKSGDSSETQAPTSSSQKTTTRLCEFFMRGKCKRRRNCPFLHCMPEEELKVRKSRIVERAKALELREHDLAALEADLKRREEVVQEDSTRIAAQSNLLDSRRSELDSARREVESMRSELFQARRQHSTLKEKYKMKEDEVKNSEAFDGTKDIVWEYLRKGNWLSFDEESTRRLEQAFRKLQASPGASTPAQSASSSSRSAKSTPSKSKSTKQQLAAKRSSAGGAALRAPRKSGTKSASAGAKSVSAAGAKSASAAGDEIIVVINDRPHQCNVRTFTRLDPVAKSKSRIRRSNATTSFEKVTNGVRIKSIGGIFDQLKLRNFSEVERFVENAHFPSPHTVEQVLKSCMLIQPRKMSYTFKPSKSATKNQLLFHATSAENALKIQAGQFIPSNSGMLGQGIYFAPCPEKSAGYFRGGVRTMLLCYVNLDNATTRGTDAMVEYCVDKPEKCLPLYMLVF